MVAEFSRAKRESPVWVFYKVILKDFIILLLFPHRSRDGKHQS